MRAIVTIERTVVLHQQIIKILMKNLHLLKGGALSLQKPSIIRALFLPLAVLCLPRLLQAQVLEAISYQAVVRDASNNLVGNQNITVRISILKNSPNGAIEYQETHSGVVTTPAGIIGLSIGQGVPTGSYVFADIDWQNGSYFVKQEIDLNTDNTYDIFGDGVPLLSVPYAQHSKTANRAARATQADIASSVAGDFVSSLAVPVGTILPFAGSSGYVENNLPDWRICNGSSLSPAEFPALNAVIGNTYGNIGNEIRLPNLQGRFPVGVDVGQTEFNTLGANGAGGAKSTTLSESNIPAHQHGVNLSATTTSDGAHRHRIEYPFSSSEGGNGDVSILGDDQNSGNWSTRGEIISTAGAHTHTVNINGNTQSTGGNQPFTNLPPYLPINFIIKVR